GPYAGGKTTAGIAPVLCRTSAPGGSGGPACPIGNGVALCAESLPPVSSNTASRITNRMQIARGRLTMTMKDGARNGIAASEHKYRRDERPTPHQHTAAGASDK